MSEKLKRRLIMNIAAAFVAGMVLVVVIAASTIIGISFLAAFVMWCWEPVATIPWLPALRLIVAAGFIIGAWFASDVWRGRAEFDLWADGTLRSDQLNSLVMVANGHDGPVLWGAWLSAEGFLQAASQRNGHWMLTTRGEQVVADYLNGDDPTKADASQSNGSKQAPADGDNK